MVEQDGGGEQGDQSGKNIEYTREITRTVRFLVVCGTVIFCVWKICNTVIRLFDKPTWTEVILTITAAVLAPTGVATIAIRRLRSGAKIRNDLLKQAQLGVDHTRTSSGLKPNGTNPKEDRI